MIAPITAAQERSAERLSVQPRSASRYSDAEARRNAADDGRIQKLVSAYPIVSLGIAGAIGITLGCLVKRRA